MFEEFHISIQIQQVRCCFSLHNFTRGIEILRNKAMKWYLKKQTIPNPPFSPNLPLPSPQHTPKKTQPKTKQNKNKQRKNTTNPNTKGRPITKNYFNEKRCLVKEHLIYDNKPTWFRHGLCFILEASCVSNSNRFSPNREAEHFDYRIEQAALPFWANSIQM